MAAITQQALILDSQNQLRNADRLARDWAIAHAGAYQGQARRELGGSGQFREWRRDNLTIRISKLTPAAVKQGQLVSVRYEHSASAEPYVAYLMTYIPAGTERLGGYLMSVAALPDALGKAELPWDEKAGLTGLETLAATVNTDRARPSDTMGGRGVAAIDDLFDHHDTAIVLTEDGQQGSEFRELADQHSDWAAVVSISAAEQLAISRELPDHQLAAWVRAKIALFSRYADENGIRLRMVAADGERAAVFVAEERDRAINGAANRNALALLELLESVSIILSPTMLTATKVMADALVESTVRPETEPPGTGGSDSVAAQQRIYVLEDQLGVANTTIAELRERLAQHESYNPAAPSDDGGGKEQPETTAARETAVLDAVTDPSRFPRLRFLTNCAKPLDSYGKLRPNGAEIVAALDAINKLAQAWYNTPGGAIGPWDNYFNHLTGWSHANGESSFTMARYGDKRSFSDQEQRRRVTIERHLTYRGSSAGLQIYFDKDDVTDTFIIGYIGEHLPYATNRS